MAADPELIEVQQRTLFMLPYYRQAKYDDYIALSMSQKEQAEAQMQVPLHPGGVNAWPDLDDGDFDVDHRSPDEDGPYDSLVDLDEEEREEVKEAVRAAAQTLPKTFKFVKLLGWGGEGVAVLFRQWDRRGRVKEYVAKFQAPDGVRTPHDEARQMKEFRGAKHVLQVHDIPMNPKAKKLMVFLEYCPGGSLEGVLRRVATRYNNGRGNKAPVRDRTLWLIFDCLFQMILALRYPPKRWHPEYNEDLDQALWERIPTAQDVAWAPPARTRAQKAALARGDLHRARDRERARSWVHFDIDPSNVLVKSLEPDGDLRHQLVPGMKLSDFSRCTDVNELSSNPLQMWASIWWGKNGWQTPEQFSTEWDWVELFPNGAKVAGQYSWKTNLWGMGFIMWCLITHCVPPYGPYPEAFSEPNFPNRWSYGVYILNDDIPRFRSVDKDLRKLVMRCLMDDPAHRPSMAEISQAIRAKLDPPGPWPASGPNSDYDMRHHSRLGARQLGDMFVNPPVPNHSDHDLAQWLEGNLDIIGDA